MLFFTPGEALLAGLLAIRRFGRLRGSLLGIALVCGSIYALPPVACGCFRPILRRCDVSRGWMAGLRSDLKNLASQEEILFAYDGFYSADPEELGYVSSNGITVAIEATPDGWAAWATHAALGEREGCALSWGRRPDLDALGPVAAELLAGAEPGALTCTRRR